MDLYIKVKPNSRQSGVLFENGTMVVRVKAPPTDGKANKELLEYLSEVLGVPKSRIEISSGAGSKFKRISIPGEYETKVERIIAGLTK